MYFISPLPWLFPSWSACLSQGRKSFSEAKTALSAEVPWPSDLLSWAAQGLGSRSNLSSEKEAGSIWTGHVPNQPLHKAPAPAWWLSWLGPSTLIQSRQEQSQKHHLWTAARWQCRAWCHHHGFERSPCAQHPGTNPTPKPPIELMSGLWGHRAVGRPLAGQCWDDGPVPCTHQAGARSGRMRHPPCSHGHQQGACSWAQGPPGTSDRTWSLQGGSPAAPHGTSNRT